MPKWKKGKGKQSPETAEFPIKLVKLKNEGSSKTKNHFPDQEEGKNIRKFAVLQFVYILHLDKKGGEW